MKGFLLLTGAYLLFEVALIACYLVVPLAVDLPGYRGWLAFALTLGALLVLASVGVIIALVARHRSRGLAAALFGVCALAVAVGGGFGVWGWAEEWAAGQPLPIINIGILLIPLGLVLGALLWVGAALPERPARR